MRDLTTQELAQVSGGITPPFSLAVNQPIGSIPVFSLTFDGKGGTIFFNGITLPFGAGLPAIHLP